MATNWIGIDIGGANLKLATKRECYSVPFELWKQSENLPAALKELFAKTEPFDRIAVTMTGELADCYESKAEGVASICDAVMNVAADKRPVFYQTTGQFVGNRQAKSEWQRTAAANWHALAAFVGLQVPNCLVVDIGSTTTDIIPVQNGTPTTIGNTDLTRLQNSELLYTGVSRTPICAVCKSVQLNGQQTPLAAELFATMLDVYLLLGKIPTTNDNNHTADGRAANKPAARRRIAKMACADADELDPSMILEIVHQVAAEQQRMIGHAVKKVLTRIANIQHVIVAGEGDWLVKSVLSSSKEFQNTICSITDLAGDPTTSKLISSTGPAHAVAQLAQNKLG